MPASRRGRSSPSCRADPRTPAILAGWVSACVRGSLERLRIPRLYGLLLHRPEQLLEPEGASIYRALVGLKGEGLVEKVGVSIYDPAELSALCSAYQFDLVQAPFNLLDRRLIRQRLARPAGGLGCRGACPIGVPPGVARHAGLTPTRRSSIVGLRLLERYDRWLDETGLTPLQACLRDALSVPEISRVVVGIDSLAQLEANLHGSRRCPAADPGMACDTRFRFVESLPVGRPRLTGAGHETVDAER